MGDSRDKERQKLGTRFSKNKSFAWRARKRNDQNDGFRRDSPENTSR